MINNKASLYKIKPRTQRVLCNPQTYIPFLLIFIGFLFVGVALNTNLFSLALIEAPPQKRLVF